MSEPSDDEVDAFREDRELGPHQDWTSSGQVFLAGGEVREWLIAHADQKVRVRLDVADSRRWGIYDDSQHRWWPRTFSTKANAQMYLDRCKSQGANGQVRIIE